MVVVTPSVLVGFTHTLMVNSSSSAWRTSDEPTRGELVPFVSSMDNALTMLTLPIDPVGMMESVMFEVNEVCLKEL
jgi:hypothetical protein